MREWPNNLCARLYNDEFACHQENKGEQASTLVGANDFFIARVSQTWAQKGPARATHFVSGTSLFY